MILDSQEVLVRKTKKRPKKSAAFGGRLLVLFWGLKYNHLLRVRNEIYTYLVCLMEHMCFEVQLCTKILMFNDFLLRYFGFPARSSLGAQLLVTRYMVEVRDSPHGIFGSCTRYPRGLTKCSELLGRRRRCRRRRRRHLDIQVDIQARKLYLEFVPMDLDSDETSRDIDTAVLHRISISFIWAEWFCLRSHF